MNREPSRIWAPPHRGCFLRGEQSKKLWASQEPSLYLLSHGSCYWKSGPKHWNLLAWWEQRSWSQGSTGTWAPWSNRHDRSCDPSNHDRYATGYCLLCLGLNPFFFLQWKWGERVSLLKAGQQKFSGKHSMTTSTISYPHLLSLCKFFYGYKVI